MALTDTDRRRLLIAVAVTVIVLPALWWANSSSDSTAPNMAVAGIDATAVAAGAPNAPGDTLIDGSQAPAFLEGPSSQAGAGRQVIAVPARPSVDGLRAEATYRNSVRGMRSCLVPNVASGTEVAIVHLDNGRSLTCTATIAPTDVTEVVLSPQAFAMLADLTDAPIAVEIRR